MWAYHLIKLKNLQISWARGHRYACVHPTLFCKMHAIGLSGEDSHCGGGILSRVAHDSPQHARSSRALKGLR